MAKSTWDGSSDPEVQAEPLDPQMPAISSLMRRDSPSINWKAKFTLPGRRLVREPLILVKGTSSMTRFIR